MRIDINSNKTFWTDIRIWIAVVFFIRLWGVSNPPLDRFDSWRQSITAMTMRNFIEVNPNLFFPRIDFAGDLSGIVGMEFPIYNGIAALLTWGMGLEVSWLDMVARLLNMFVTSVGVFYFYKTVSEFVSEEIAFPASLLLLCSIWMLYGRKIMPDTFAAGLGLVGIYYGLIYAVRGTLGAMLKFVFLMSLAMLSKISVAFMLVYPAILLFRNGEYVSRRMLVLTGGITSSLGLVVLWYFWWAPSLTAQFGFEHFFMGRPLVEGWSQITENWLQTLERFTTVSIGYSGTVLMVIGMLSIVWRRNRILLVIFVVGLIAFTPFVIKSGFNFYHHKYYVIPFVPVLCLFAGYGVHALKQRGLIWLLPFVLIFFFEQGNRMFRDLNSKRNYLLNLSTQLDKVSKRSDLILINSGNDPTPMYFSRRKGWLATDAQIQSSSYLADLEARGLKFVVLIKSSNRGQKIQLDQSPVYQDDNFTIWRIGRTAALNS